MSKKIIYLLFICLLTIAAFSFSTLAYAHNESWTCSSDYGTTPKIDGQINPADEWADANMISFDAPDAKNQVTVYMKAIPGDYPGGGRLYLCYVIPNILAGASFQWDSLHDLGRAPRVDDRRITAERPSQEFGGFYFAEGTGSKWNPVSQPAGFEGKISAGGKINWIVEMAIPYAWLGIKICNPGPRGCSFDATGVDPDGKVITYYWPPANATGTNYNIPATWGNMVPSDCWGFPPCPKGCECLTEAQAKEKYGPGGYEKCREEICGEAALGPVTAAPAGTVVPKYCFRPKPLCPDKCTCLTEEEAKKLGYSYCQNEKILCGYDDQKKPKYCYEPSVQPECDLSIQKIATADTVMAGENIAYNILVANSSSQTIEKVKVTDKLPAEVSFVSADHGGTYAPGTGIVTWELGTLTPGGWVKLSLVVKVDPSTIEDTIIHNKATASALRCRPVESEDEVVVVGGKVHEAFIKGYPGGTFGPQRNVTRGEIAAIIARLLHLESLVTGTQFYSDVPSSHWTFKYVEAVNKADIMKGFPDGTFRPDQPATRADVAVAMLRAREIDPVVFLPVPPFPDISGHWAIEEIETAYILGVVEGLPDGTFHPNDPIIRSETVTLMCRALGRGPLLEGFVTQHFPDCTPADWFYGWGEESFATHKGVRMASGNEKLIEYVPSPPVW